MIINLSDIGLGDAPRSGGKAAALGEMMRHGLRVPEGAAVSVAVFRRFLRHNHITLDSEKIPAENERVHAALLRGTFPAEDEADLRTLFDGLYVTGGEGLVARSSALCEDDKRMSFAGIFETVTGIKAAEDLLHAIKACYASLFTDKALDYAWEHRVRFKNLEMGIAVQRFKRGRPSGVLFTADPVSFDPDVTVINWVEDVCAAYVSGAASSRRLRVDRRRKTEATPEGLTRREVDSLLNLGATCDRIFGPRRDIEWTFADGTLHALQCRPVTGWKNRDFPVAWEHEQDKDVAWHLEYGPVPPLEREAVLAGYASANDGAARSGLEWFYEEHRFWNGYLYTRRMDLPDAAARREAYQTYVSALAREGKNVFTDVHLPPIAALYDELNRRFRPDMPDRELAEHLEHCFQAMIDIGGRHWLVVQGCLEAAAIQEFRERYGLKSHECVLLVEQATWQSRYQAGILDMARAVKGERILADLFRDHESAAVIDAHLEAWAAGGSRTRDAAERYLATRRAFLSHFGLYRHDWNDPRILLENPRRVTAEVRRRLHRDPEAPADVLNRRRKTQSDFMAALPGRLGAELWRRLQDELPAYRKAYLVRDDHAHFIDLQSGGPYRRACLLAGKRLAEGAVLKEAGDVVFLHKDELRAALAEGLPEAHALVTERQRAFAAGQALVAPGTIGREPVAPRAEIPARAPDQAVFAGYAGLNAVVRGEVRYKKDIPLLDGGRYIFVFKDVREMDYSTILDSAAGIVFERGSPFDHVGIWARENNIPTLFGASGAADGLETGDLVELDGGNEELRLVRKFDHLSGM